jgi:hypothetical protein
VSNILDLIGKLVTHASDAHCRFPRFLWKALLESMTSAQCHRVLSEAAQTTCVACVAVPSKIGVSHVKNDMSTSTVILKKLKNKKVLHVNPKVV